MYAESKNVTPGNALFIRVEVTPEYLVEVVNFSEFPFVSGEAPVT
jgi:hypothetical protein